MTEDGYLEKILKSRVYDVVSETPLEFAPRLSERLGCHVLIKREYLHSVFSFKIRGAYNKIASLSPEQAARGVVAASAGNHAQGVALAARRLNLKALIVMPATTPRIKVEAVRAWGAEILLTGDTFDVALAEAERLRAERGLTWIPPYDDPDVIAGQGTVALEIVRQHRAAIDAIFVPVGGGGLIAGVAAFVKRLYPQTRVIGVEPEDAACLHGALRANERILLDRVGIFADGVAVRQVGAEPWKIAQRWVDDVITVTTDEICAAIKDIFEDNRSIAEPAGALAVAGLKAYATTHSLSGQTCVAIESGANIGFDRLRHVAERAELGEAREALLAVTIPERAGSFLGFCESLGRLPITEFNYRYCDPEQAHLFVGVGLSGGVVERQSIIQRVREGGYPTLDLSDDEMSKTHMRFMVGGRVLGLRDERLCSFEFPERPGALLSFLRELSGRWNITLFHYRNHGAAFGRVLAGIQVPEAELTSFRETLGRIGYQYREETSNPAYALFLGAQSTNN
ncbi:MAG TPA: threonine ammonia-lyase, biosynthetic [Polyangiaceae bacterium]|nr:threonine ammonia-lyase, biosynthetic [Polyangiaceae bacterium]